MNNILKFSAEESQRLEDLIHKKFSDGKSWLDIKELTFKRSNSIEERILDVKYEEDIKSNFEYSDWVELVNRIENRYNEELRQRRKQSISKDLAKDIVIPIDKRAAWTNYKKCLESKFWDDEAIYQLQQSVHSIMERLTFDSENGPGKGLVIGNVQSGKTANIAGLMALAADHGFNYFIILSGTIENLRLQTSNRLHSDLSFGESKYSWNNIDKPNTRSRDTNHDKSIMDFSKYSKSRYFTVMLKNKIILENFLNWFGEDKHILKQMKILIIDDEADQASINTNKTDEDRTTINNLILSLVHTYQVHSMNYISYTATPYANVLNEFGENTLYPSDFIINLPKSPNYFGPSEIFGVLKPEGEPSINIVREIDNIDGEILNEIHEGSTFETPPSLQKAIKWYILASLALRCIGRDKPTTMLIHTHLKQFYHDQLYEVVSKFLTYLKNNYESELDSFKTLYEEETKRFTVEDLLKGMPNYTISKEDLKDYPEWREVKIHLDSFFNLSSESYLGNISISVQGHKSYVEGINLVIDNSSQNEEVRLYYPKGQTPISYMFIVVGGNTLSRGLTLEGLITSYFFRNSKQVDTLMQMGRWFGFRIGYEIYPRIWLNQELRDKFSFISDVNEELYSEIMYFAQFGKSPKEYAPRVKQSPNYNFLKITALNKMQSAHAANYDFARYSPQTIYFEKNIEVLRNNLDITSGFLNTLGKPTRVNNNLIWNDIELNKVSKFFEKYKVNNKDLKMSVLPSVNEWLISNESKFDNWSVVLAGKENTNNDNSNSTWEFYGEKIQSVTRTAKSIDPVNNYVNIGVLRSPSHLLIDLKAKGLAITEEKYANGKPSEIYDIRQKYGFGNTPLLLIYIIDKNSKPQKNSNRKPLDFPLDLVGISLLIPGDISRKNNVTYISIDNELLKDNFEEYID